MDNNDGGGEEVTRINIVYFLSRDGKVEHPHLIRIHHRHHGLRLQDVKRWLSDLRGKEMPDAFAWSYKRRYKTGYVWQDLKDQDLITPISGNEYVLKGSWIPCSPSASTNIDRFSREKKNPNSGQLSGKEETPVMIRHKPSAADTFRFDDDDDDDDDDDIKISPPAELDQDSVPDERTAVFKMDMHRHVKQLQAERRWDKVAGGGGEEGRSSTSSAAGRASHVFRNILTCGLVETNDSALRPVDRDMTSNKSTSNGKKRLGKAGEKAVPVMYRPICSQCAKSFRPEKLHSHMKSCKALKGRSKT